MLLLQQCNSRCDTNRHLLQHEVLLAVFAKLVELLTSREDPTSTTWNDVSVVGDDVSCIVYDVSRQPVSVHVPLTRLLAGVFSKTTLLGITPADLMTSLPASVRASHVSRHLRIMF